MAYKNKITNPVTGQDFKFLQTSQDTGGALLEMVSTYHSQSKEPPPHYHPYQEEDFIVMEGELTVRTEGKLCKLIAGDRLHIGKKQVHSMWNATDQKTVINWKTRPALDTEYLLETITGLACDGKTDKDGRPNILQVALMTNKYSDSFRLAKPSYVIQKLVFGLLTPVAYLAGYKPSYEMYFK